jgi:DNA-directed RNA polymerase subunit E'/Rpb7
MDILSDKSRLKMIHSTSVEPSPIMTTMEQIAIFQEKVSLAPIDLRPEITNFDDIIIEKLRKRLEGKCTKNGFVIPQSLQLLSRSMGVAEKGRATADFLYYVKAQGRVYNPPDGLIVEGIIKLKNKMGCYVILKDAVRIMIPRDLHIGNEEFDELDVGDHIRIEIKKSQFRANATHILSIGQYLNKVGNPSTEVPVAQDADAVDEEEGEGEEEEE